MPLNFGTELILPKISPASNKKNEAKNILHETRVVCQDYANLEPVHYQELLNSGIDPGIIALNFQSLDGSITHEYLLSDALASFNPSE